VRTTNHSLGCKNRQVSVYQSKKVASLVARHADTQSSCATTYTTNMRLL
jgi:hypothetical protein